MYYPAPDVCFFIMIPQIDEHTPPDEDGLEQLHDEELTKKGKKKRDSTALRKAPQGKSVNLVSLRLCAISELKLS